MLSHKCPLESCSFQSANPSTIISHWSRKHKAKEGSYRDAKREMEENASYHDNRHGCDELDDSFEEDASPKVAPVASTSGTVEELECLLASCQFSCTNRDSMVSHMLSHKCPLPSCSFKSANQSTIISHWSRKHKATEGSYLDAKREIEDPSAFPFCCDKCNRKFATSVALYHHNRRGCAE